MVPLWTTVRLVVLVGLMMVPAMLIWSLVPVVFGWRSQVILSGSMAPRIHPGDVVVAQPRTADQVTPGQVVLVDNPARPGTLLLHRVVRREPDGSLVTRGDANPDVDSTPVPAARVRGLGRLRVPFIGLPVLWAREGRYGALAATGVAAVLFVAASALVLRDPSRPKGRARAGP